MIERNGSAKSPKIEIIVLVELSCEVEIANVLGLSCVNVLLEE